MSDCERFREWCQERLDDGQIPPGESPADHASRCPDCYAFQESLTLVHRSLEAHLPQGDPPPLPSSLAKPPTPPGRPWWLGWAVPILATLIVALSLLAVWLLRSKEPARTGPGLPPVAEAARLFVLHIDTTAVFLRPTESEAEQPVPQGKGTPLADQSLVRCDAKGRGHLEGRDGSALSLGPGTELQLQGEGIRLKLGEIWVSIRAKGSRFTVLTPTAVLGVRGTRFGVTVARDGSTRVRCEEGTVWVKGQGNPAEQVVTAGRQVGIDPQGTPGQILDWSAGEDPGRTVQGQEFMKQPVRIEKSGR